MLIAAAHTLSEHSPAIADPADRLLPALADLRRVSKEIAVAVGKEAQRAGLAPPTSEEELRHSVNLRQWTPAYA